MVFKNIGRESCAAVIVRLKSATGAIPLAGKHKIGPIHFDAAGQWTIRFHIYEECSELLETSPHGHVAFYIAVP